MKLQDISEAEFSYGFRISAVALSSNYPSSDHELNGGFSTFRRIYSGTFCGVCFVVDICFATWLRRKTFSWWYFHAVRKHTLYDIHSSSMRASFLWCVRASSRGLYLGVVVLRCTGNVARLHGGNIRCGMHFPTDPLLVAVLVARSLSLSQVC